MKTFIFIYFILVLGVGIDDKENRRAAMKWKTARDFIYSLIAYFIVAAVITAIVAAIIYFLVHL